MIKREKYIVEPEDEFLLIKKKKKDKVKKLFKKEIDATLLELVDEDSFEEYEKRIKNWKWGD